MINLWLRTSKNYNVCSFRAPGWLFVEHLTLNLSSSHDLKIHRFELQVRLCAGSTEPASDSVSAPICLKINKLKTFFSKMDAVSGTWVSQSVTFASWFWHRSWSHSLWNRVLHWSLHADSRACLRFISPWAPLPYSCVLSKNKINLLKK